MTRNSAAEMAMTPEYRLSLMQDVVNNTSPGKEHHDIRGSDVTENFIAVSPAALRQRYPPKASG